MMKRLPIKLTAHWHGLRSDSYSRQWRTVGVSVQGIRWAVTPWAARCPLISRRRYASWERPDFCTKYRQCVHPFKILRRCIVRRKRQRPITDGLQKQGQKLSHGRAFLFCEPGRGFRGGAPNKGIMLAGFNACYSLKSQSPALLECVFYANTNTFFAVNLDSNTRSRYTEINQKK